MLEDRETNQRFFSATHMAVAKRNQSNQHIFLVQDFKNFKYRQIWWRTDCIFHNQVQVKKDTFPAGQVKVSKFTSYYRHILT